MGQTYKNNIKRPKPPDTQLGTLKSDLLYWKIQQKASGPRETVILAFQKLSGSRKGAVGA